MQVPCRIHASPTRNPCRTHADLTQNQRNTHAESTQKPRRIHANHTRIRALFFCCIRPSTCHSSRHSFRRLLRSRVATQIRSGVSGQAARNASSKAFRSSFRSRSMRAATTASGPPRRSSSKHVRNEEQARLLSLARSCGNLRLRNHWLEPEAAKAKAWVRGPGV